MSGDVDFATALRNRAAEAGTVSPSEAVRLASVLNASCLSSLPSQSPPKEAVVCIQCLANLSTHPNRNSHWHLFYPLLISKALSLRHPKILDPLCYALYNHAVDGSYSLDHPGTEIFNSIAAFYAQEIDRLSLTSFTLLFDRMFKIDGAKLFDIPWTMESVKGLDVSLLSQETVTGLTEALLTSIKGGDRKRLKALAHCVLSFRCDDALLMEVASWGVDRLRVVRNEGQKMKGEKTDVVAVLANVAWQRSNVQDRIVELGGMEMVLDCIGIDEMNPFVREWGLLFVRNMCIENPRAQECIRGLELQDVVVDDRLGMEITYDKATGRFSAKRR